MLGIYSITTQQNTIPHNRTRYNKKRQDTKTHNTTPQNTTQHDKTQHNTTRQNTTQHDKTQHNTTKHNTQQTQERNINALSGVWNHDSSDWVYALDCLATGINCDILITIFIVLLVENCTWTRCWAIRNAISF